jgi:hypothetical protein
MESCELVSLISAIACVLAQNCTTEELTLLSASLTQLGDTINSILVNNELCENTRKS